jgi:transposase
MKCFRSFDLGQTLLLPPDLRDWLPEGHLARFVAEVIGELNLSEIFAGYEGDGRGQAAYHPRMMAGLLIYGYCSGVFSSRRIERATFEDVAFRFLSGDQHPDHDTIAAFRERHLDALKGLFMQVLKLCEKAGLVKLGHVALDGTKVKANASKHKAMSYDHMCKREQELAQQIAGLMAQASSTDAAEDQQYGRGKTSEQLPADLARATQRLAKIREAKAALEHEARAAAEQRKAEVEAALIERARREAETGKSVGGPKPAAPDPATATPEAKAQRNFTDPESKIMKDGATKGFEQAYNAQIVVDDAHQIIVAEQLIVQTNDKQQLAPMLAQVEANLGRKPTVASADAGYYADSQLLDQRLEGIDLHVPPDRQKHHQPPPPGGPPPPGESPPPGGPPLMEEEADQSPPTPKTRIADMRSKLKSAAGYAIYRMRKAIVEPVFGQIKQARGFRRFSFRGQTKTGAEWSLICTTHNLLKLWRSGWRPA